MSMFEWKKEYSVGYAEIDAQHKKLFALAAELHASMAAGKGKEILSRTLADLVNYTRLHFATEERLMQTHHYPDYAKHKADHDTLTARVVEFQTEFEHGRVAVTVGLLQFLKDWLQHHIAGTDQKIAAFLNSKAA